jgi:hypothetical protein
MLQESRRHRTFVIVVGWVAVAAARRTVTSGTMHS